MKKKIINHKWFCKKHQRWIGEDYKCPLCENNVMVEKIKNSSLKKKKGVNYGKRKMDLQR
uniref:Uncharacterized protein n=1 Tax=viral metagenome TaxID=1070528 RepID=A0A6M3LIG3_9ZZZZ